MYEVLAEKLIVASSTPSYTDAIEMIDANALNIDFEILAMPAAKIQVDVEQSNDLENWKLHTTTTGRTAIGSSQYKVDTIAARFVRLKVYFLSGSGTASVVLGVATKAL
jgi:hypothetical protein